MIKLVREYPLMRHALSMPPWFVPPLPHQFLYFLPPKTAIASFSPFTHESDWVVYFICQRSGRFWDPWNWLTSHFSTAYSFNSDLTKSSEIGSVLNPAYLES